MSANVGYVRFVACAALVILTFAALMWQEDRHWKECVASCGSRGVYRVDETWTGHICHCQEEARQP
jgi:hypothetical protein